MATQPMSMDMSGWAAMRETQSPANAASDSPGFNQALQDKAEEVSSSEIHCGKVREKERSRAESQLGSIAAWQAIAAEVRCKDS